MGNEYSGQGGGLYAHASAVTNEAANEVAEFRGTWTLELMTETAEWSGQRRVRKSAEVVGTDVRLTVEEVAFKAANLETIYGLTKNASDNLKSAGAEEATSYSLDGDTVPPELQWLVDCKMGAKTFQIFAGDGIAIGVPIVFTNKNIVVHSIELVIYSATGDLVKMLLEN